MKKGFTLVELLAVITILGVLMIIAVPQIASVINVSKEEAYKKQIEFIESSAKDYASKNSLSLPDMVDDYTLCISIDTLKQEGFLRNEDIKDPKKNSYISGSVIITYKNNKYIYTYSENAC